MNTPRLFAILLSFCFSVVSAPAQQQLNIDASKSCNYHGGMVPDKPIYGFASDKEAVSAVKRILSYSGLEPNFEITAANVPNAAAVLDNTGEKRLILYNQDFMERIKDATKTDWSAISILAHEIGHHLQGHTLKPGGSRPPSELEADKYSGFVVGMLGGSLDDAQAVMKAIASDEGSATHPAKDARLAAITNGWKQAQDLFEKGQATRPTNPGTGAIYRPAPKPVTPKSSRYTGNVGRQQAVYSITWNPDRTVSGTYYYPNWNQGTTYRLIGNNHTDGKLYLEEYTGSAISARIHLTKTLTAGEIVWSGKMYNTDGKIFDIRMARSR